MYKMLNTHQNTIGILMIALFFVGGSIFMSTDSWDASDLDAANGYSDGDQSATILTVSSTNGCDGGTNELSVSTNNCPCCRNLW